MENAVDALQIGFAVFVLVLALVLTFSVISTARSTSDYVMYYSDETNFYSNLNSKEEDRIVTVANVISTLHKYYTESISVTVILGGAEYIFDSGRETVVDVDGNIDSDAVPPTTSALKDKNLNNFIYEQLLKIYKDELFVEEFTEAPFGGESLEADDGSSIPIIPGGNKIYITYKIL